MRGRPKPALLTTMSSATPRVERALDERRRRPAASAMSPRIGDRRRRPRPRSRRRRRAPGSSSVAAPSVVDARVVHDDTCAVRREPQRVRTSDAASRAGDDRDPFTEIDHSRTFALSDWRDPRRGRPLGRTTARGCGRRDRRCSPSSRPAGPSRSVRTPRTRRPWRRRTVGRPRRGRATPSTEVPVDAAETLVDVGDLDQHDDERRVRSLIHATDVPRPSRAVGTAMYDVHAGEALVEREAGLEIGDRQRDMRDTPVDGHDRQLRRRVLAVANADRAQTCQSPSPTLVLPYAEHGRTGRGPTFRRHGRHRRATPLQPLSSKVKLHITVPADEFDKAIDAAFRKLAREVRIPGFRPGQGAPPAARGASRHRHRARAGAAATRCRSTTSTRSPSTTST